ncbi:aryl-alcohol oxidase-like protein [Phlegmacium glaucopus]|nr:aryl-alcohol oxidase-like protein [Phlegmacium glaucopus]
MVFFFNHLSLLVLSVAAVTSSVSGALFTNPSQVPKNTKYDFIIVGGGAGGAVLANRLTELPGFHVLLIEAGSSDFNNPAITIPGLAATLTNTQFDWNFTTVNQPGMNGRPLAYPRGHVLGGSTSINFMAFTRGSKDDYNRWAKVTGDQGWSWNSLFPYMLKMERITQPVDNRNTAGEFNPSVHGTSGPVNTSLPAQLVSTDNIILQASQQLSSEFPFNLDFNSGNTIGIGWAQFTISDGQRASAATSYIAPALANHPNLDVLVNTVVTRVLETGTQSGKPVFRGVEFAQSASSPRQVLNATKEVILSAGAVKTPHILMLSGIGRPADLSPFGINTIVNLPDVGQNLQDHPLVTSSFSVNESVTTLDPLLENGTFAAIQFAQWENNHSGELALGAANQLGWLRLPKNASIFQTVQDPSAGPTSAHFEFILSDEFLSFTEPFPTSGNFFTMFTNLVSPLARGNLSLRSSSPFDSPVINPNFLGNQFDIFAMRESIKAARTFMAAPAWNGWITGEVGAFAQAQTDAQIEQYVRNTCSTVNHVAGTVAMGKTGSTGSGTGALNSDLTVKGTVGLRVVDASTFPFIPAAHTQTPTYIVAERAADLIKQTWSSGSGGH